MSGSKTVIVGSQVPDQTRLRPRRPVKDLEEFLEFLARLEAVFGRIEQTRRITTGKRFLL